MIIVRIATRISGMNIPNAKYITLFSSNETLKFNGRSGVSMFERMSFTCSVIFRNKGIENFLNWHVKNYIRYKFVRKQGA